MEIGLGPDEIQHVGPDLVVAVPHHRVGPGELGGDTVDDVRHRAACPLVEEVLAVERDHGRGLALTQERGDGRGRAQSGVDPAFECDDQDRSVELGLLVDREDLRQTVRAHGVAAKASEAMSARRATCAGYASTLLLVAGPGAGDVTGVDALQDAGQLPVTEGAVVPDLGQIEIGHAAVVLHHLRAGGEARARWSANDRART